MRALSGMRALAVLLALTLSAAATPAWPRSAPGAGPAHGLSIHGDLKYGPGFTQFDYVNPRAPKGGSVTLPAIGTFDNLNPFILKGVPAARAPPPLAHATGAPTDAPSPRYPRAVRT